MPHPLVLELLVVEESWGSLTILEHLLYARHEAGTLDTSSHLMGGQTWEVSRFRSSLLP